MDQAMENLMNDVVTVSTYGNISYLLQEYEQQKKELESTSSVNPIKSPKMKPKKNKKKQGNFIIVPDDDELYVYSPRTHHKTNSNLNISYSDVNEQIQRELVKELDSDILRNEEIERFYSHERSRLRSEWKDYSDDDEKEETQPAIPKMNSSDDYEEEETPPAISKININDSQEKPKDLPPSVPVIKKKNKKIRNTVLNSLKNMGKLPVGLGENDPETLKNTEITDGCMENAAIKDLASFSESSKQNDFFVDDTADKLNVDPYVLETFLSSFSKKNKESDDEEFQSLNDTNSSGEYVSASSGNTPSPLKEMAYIKKKGYHKTSKRSTLTDDNICFAAKTPQRKTVNKSKAKLPEQEYPYEVYIPKIVKTDFTFNPADFPRLK